MALCCLYLLIELVQLVLLNIQIAQYFYYASFF